MQQRQHGNENFTSKIYSHFQTSMQFFPLIEIVKYQRNVLEMNSEGRYPSWEKQDKMALCLRPSWTLL